jgi:hypothetical protein
MTGDRSQSSSTAGLGSGVVRARLGVATISADVTDETAAHRILAEVRRRCHFPPASPTTLGEPSPAKRAGNATRPRDMDKTALVDLLHEINAKSPPKPELVVKLGKMIAAEPAFFDVKGSVNRFDRAGYGYSAQVKREPIYLLVFVVADLCREGLQPEYLRKLHEVWRDNPRWFASATP